MVFKGLGFTLLTILMLLEWRLTWHDKDYHSPLGPDSSLCMSYASHQGCNFKWRTPVKIAGNKQNLKRFLYSKPDFDGFHKILAVFDR